MHACCGSQILFTRPNISIEALLEKSAAKSSSRSVLMYYVLMAILLIRFAIFSYSVNRTKRKKYQNKTNNSVKLTKIPFTIKIRGKRESCFIPCSSVIRFRIFEMFHWSTLLFDFAHLFETRFSLTLSASIECTIFWPRVVLTCQKQTPVLDGL